MKVRLVAYRKATTGATVDSSYELDLQESPNISLNFQFSDVKEPEKRKANFSQTFKLPFTDNNNKFFQDWYNVNASTLVFDTRKSFDAVLFADGVSQFEGIIQLKAVYKKAQFYQVVLLSNTADLFTVIGSNKLKDVFLNDNGTYSEELDHTFTAANVAASWDGSDSGFQNIAGTSLRDTDVNVQKVMYPMSFTIGNAYYNIDVAEYLNATSLTGDQSNLQVPITQLRPAIQIKELFRLIIAKAGFSYISSFIDGDYFGKIFITTCNHTALPRPQTEPVGQILGYTKVGNSTSWGTWNDYNFTTQYDNWSLVRADTNQPIAGLGFNTPQDPTGLWNTSGHYFTKNSVAQTGDVIVSLYLTATNVIAGSASGDGGEKTYRAKIIDFNPTTGQPDYDTVYGYTEGSYYVPNGATTGTVNFNKPIAIPLEAMPVGKSGKILVTFDGWRKATTGVGTLSYAAADTTPTSFVGCKNIVSFSWNGPTPDVYDRQVTVPAGIDPSITQKSFLKDIIERFNLVMVTDPSNPSNILIEPYNDYLAQGSIKNWTEKLDTSKEIIVKDTTQLQKKETIFTDLEDEDMSNKSIKLEAPTLNVYGKFTTTENNNDFAKGTLTNNPIFSPYINQKVFRNGEDTQASTNLPNMAVHYEFSYNQVEGGYENIISETKPKLFFYNGSPINIQDESANAITIYFHHQDKNTSVITSYSFQTYPLCSPYNLTPSSGESTIATTTKSLYWSPAPPLAGELTVFNSDVNGTIPQNSLYYLYWNNYLNSIYGEDARIMECHLNLNEVDIFNFKFNDEIFIRDTWWRILKIQNYQVGQKVSTKTTLIKINDTYDGTCYECNYVVSQVPLNNNVVGMYTWCPSGTPNCTPTVTNANQTGVYADSECCDCLGGTIIDIEPPPSLGIDLSLRPCLANSNSLPAWIQNQRNARGIFSNSQIKTIFEGKLAKLNKPFIVGTNNTKTSTALLPYNGDDLVIKFRNENLSIPSVNGEAHRMVLIGYTTGNTRGYAYPQGVTGTKNPVIPNNSNMIIRINGTTVVVGGTNSSYPTGYLEAFSWYTAFKNIEGTITQIGTAGGIQQFNIAEVASRTSLYISHSNGEISFGLDDLQTDTKRVWSLTVDLTVQTLDNMSLGYGDNMALYQDGDGIYLQNNDWLIWN
tara:strand:- start:1927 stop:5382 length:3456 start_codon:yes stop_codon:yes gene_type:complete